MKNTRFFTSPSHGSTAVTFCDVPLTYAPSNAREQSTPCTINGTKATIINATETIDTKKYAAKASSIHTTVTPIHPNAAAIISLLGAAYLLAADIARWAYLGSVGTGLARGEWLAVGLGGIVFVPFWGLCLFAIDPKTVSPGANDNLSGCFVAVALIKALAEKESSCARRRSV